MGMKYNTPQPTWPKTLPLLMICGLLLFDSPAWAEVTLPSVLSDHMVLQRDEPVPVWGKADPGETVTVSIGDASKTTTADQAGRWRVDLSAMPAGGPFTMTVTASNTLTLEDIYIGEVWLCSGQSNMQWTVSNSADPQAEIVAADWPMIRMYTAQHTTASEPKDDVVGSWQVCSPQTAGGFSAVGYYFGRELHRELNVPIGLVHSSWGGSRAEPWTPRQTLLSHPDYAPAIKLIDEQLANYRGNEAQLAAEHQAAVKAHGQALAAWGERINTGGRGVQEGWASAGADDDSWRLIHVPGLWEGADDVLGGFDGVVWFKRTVQIPEGWAGRDLALSFGAVDDIDTTFFNGETVGATGLDTPWHWAVKRNYTVPGEQVSAGEAVISVRITDTGHGGGFAGEPKEMMLSPIDVADAEPIKLAGDWRYRIDFPMSEVPPIPVAPQDPAQVGAQFTSPAAMYNGMLHPLVPYGLRGAIWYQGESNANEAEAYRELLPLMIQGWRDVWGKPEMPFGIVQLANFMQRVDEPGDSNWAELRDAQLHTFNTVENTGLAVTTDIGDAGDIHPKNKQEVGRRLSLWAISQVYGQTIVWSGPSYQSMRIEVGKIYLSFDHIGGGLQARGGETLRGFSIAGEDHKFVWAEAEIVDDEIVVWSDQIPAPAAVRYGWADNPDTANLVNADGLPASPFRTDDWPGITSPQ